MVKQMIKQETSYTIQEISRIMDLPSSTLRYYEEVGLLDSVGRAANGHRQYTDADVSRLDFIKKLRLIGMSIEQMRDFVGLYQGGKQTAHLRREILQEHRGAVQARMEELLEMLKFIDYKINLYQQEETELDQENHEISIIG